MKFIKALMMMMVFAGSSVFAQVNINTATQKELMELMGVGPVKAASIIKYRKANGKFKAVSDLVNVDGIGELTVKNLGSDIKVSGVTDVDKIKNKKKSPASKKTTKSKDKVKAPSKAKAKKASKDKVNKKTENTKKKVKS